MYRCLSRPLANHLGKEYNSSRVGLPTSSVEQNLNIMIPGAWTIAVQQNGAITHHVLRHTLFSTAQQASSSSISKLRSIVKPFLLKCHPDVHPSASAKKINMTAIQNLNSYMDTLQSMASGTAKQHEGRDRVVEIDFVMHAEGGRGKKKDKGPNTSRRKVELMLPPTHLVHELVASMNGKSPTSAASQLRLQEHSKQEVIKLLRVAGLKIPNDISTLSFEDALEQELGLSDDFDEDNAQQPMGQPQDTSTGFRRAHNIRPKTAYERNRDKFTANIQWQNYDRIYKEAVRDMNADYATSGLIKHNEGRRRSMIAGILSRVRLQPNQDGEPISFVEQLVVFRRLSVLLESNFEDFQMEEFGEMWETCRIVLTPARDYNASGSALHKRRKKEGATTGFSFTLHPNLSVTIHIPIDFRDDELIQELDRNVWDFYDFFGDGMDELFPQQTII